MRLDAPLPPGRGIDLEHGRAGAPQVADEPRLLELAGLEEPEDAAREARRRRPAEVVPERPLAGLADLRGAEMRAKTVVAVGLVAGEDGRARRRGGLGQRRHHAPSASSDWRAVATTVAHVSSS